MQDALAYQIDETLTCEVLVVGSGLAGVCAAIEAGRLGCDVVLVDKDPVLGGNSGPMLGVHPSGAHSFHPYASETGIIGEIEEEAAWRHCKIYTPDLHYNIAQQWDSLLEWMCTEAGVRVLRRTYAKRPVMDGTRIVAVLVEDIGTFKTKRIDVSVVVIDASGDGQVAASAGAEFRMGREAQHEFNERSAPQQADAITLGTSVTALVRKTSHPVTFVPPPGTPPYEPGYGTSIEAFRAGRCLHAHSSWQPDAEFCFLWHTETGGQLHTIDDDDRIYKTLVGHLYAAWNHIKNEAHVEESRQWELVWVSPKTGKRESRRFMGDVTLTQQDVEGPTAWPDEIGYGGYAVDIHNPTGTNNEQVDVVFYSAPPLYGIPLRSTYSRNVDNLLLAGRLMSGTHLAMGTVRLQKTLATAGQGVGAAAFMCKRDDCRPRDLYSDRVGELQQMLLRRDATLLGTPNRDPDDLARRAYAAATSARVHGVTGVDDWLPLDCVRGVELWDWADRLDCVRLMLRNTGPEDASVSLELARFEAPHKYRTQQVVHGFAYEPMPNRAEWGDDRTIAAYQAVATARATVPAGAEQWVGFELGQHLVPKDPTSDDDRYLLRLGPCANVSWARSTKRYDHARRVWAEPGDVVYESDGDSHAFKLEPAPLYGEPANVLNGWNRRLATCPVNMWMADPDEPLPQSLVLTWTEPVTVGTVHVAFDTLTRVYRQMPFNCAEEVSPMCVRDYRIEAEAPGGWRELAVEIDNYRRFRVHRFDPVTTRRLRLVVLRTWDSGYSARVYEIRVYGDP